MVRLGDLSQVDTLFTDRPPPASMRPMLAATGLAIRVAAAHVNAAE
jgi:DeoR/GlpR family transcriptional regulator of sugar metabolism